jgi:hypothetical protein
LAQKGSTAAALQALLKGTALQAAEKVAIWRSFKGRSFSGCLFRQPLGRAPVP